MNRNSILTSFGLLTPDCWRTYQSPLPQPKWLNSKQPSGRLTPCSKQDSSTRQPAYSPPFRPKFNNILTELYPTSTITNQLFSHSRLNRLADCSTVQSPSPCSISFSSEIRRDSIFSDFSRKSNKKSDCDLFSIHGLKECS